MSEQWFFARGKEKFGPYTAAQLKALAQQGRLLPSDMLHKEGMPKWVPASSVKGLFASAPARPAPPPLPAAPPPRPAPPPAPPVAVSKMAGLLGGAKGLFARQTAESPAPAASPPPVPGKTTGLTQPTRPVVPGTPAFADVQATYRGGHPDWPDVVTGVLRLEERALSFTTVESTPRTIRLAYETLADVVEPQRGAFPDEMVKKAQTTQTAAQAGKFAAGVAGSLMGGFGGKLVKSVGKTAAQSVKEGAALGDPPKNRLRVLLLLSGVPHRLAFDVVAATRDEMEAKAQAFWNQTARVRNRFTTPPASAQVVIAGDSPESKLLELLRLIKELCDEGILKPAESRRLRGTVVHNKVGKLLAGKLRGSLVGSEVSLLGDDDIEDEAAEDDADEGEDAEDDTAGDDDNEDDDDDGDDDD